MRVVVIADFAEPSGGAQAVAIQSALALASRGVAVTYLHGVPGPVDGRLRASNVDLVSLDLADVWSLPAARAALDGIWNRKAAARLAAALSTLPPGPTILHLHQWTRSLSPSALPALLRAGPPVVVTLHDYFMACPNGVYYRFERDQPCSVRPLSAACLLAPCDPRSAAHKAVRVLRSAATRAAIARAAFDVIHVSDRGRDTVAPFLPPGLRHHRVDNPVEAERRAPVTIRPGGAIAFVGRLTREKGADLVAAAGREAGVPVVFIGEGPAEMDIRRIDPAAEILGWRSRAGLDELLRTSARAVAAPSRWYETGPLTIYEAVAAGLPVVASARSGAAEKVVSGETGFVVEPDVASLAAAFRALADVRTAERMGEAAYARYWAAPLDDARHAEALLRVYGDMLARRAM